MNSVGETLAQHLACFGELPPADRHAISELNADIRDLARQADALRKGDRPSNVVVVLTGLLYRYSVAPDGRRQTLVQGAIFREWLVRNSNMPAPQSLAHLFCEMFTRAEAAGLVHENSCALPLTQEFVADALGLTAVHTNRTLQALRETGVIEWRSGRLTVHDWPKLQEMAGFDPQ